MQVYVACLYIWHLASPASDAPPFLCLLLTLCMLLAFSNPYFYHSIHIHILRAPGSHMLCSHYCHGCFSCQDLFSDSIKSLVVFVHQAGPYQENQGGNPFMSQMPLGPVPQHEYQPSQGLPPRRKALICGCNYKYDTQPP